ncbi:hypothetical protein ABZ352_35615 [Streptomyces griseofuscus]|uniref:hypothetical protein n=1 Tax=Streptomyces griseofuscus TaxID=146922 RepID=UPI0033ED8CCD
MIIITGPQGTDEEVGLVAETAGLYGALPAYSVVVEWPSATALYCLVGWELCALAVADVTIAETIGIPVIPLPV